MRSSRSSFPGVAAVAMVMATMIAVAGCSDDSGTPDAGAPDAQLDTVLADSGPADLAATDQALADTGADATPADQGGGSSAVVADHAAANAFAAIPATALDNARQAFGTIFYGHTSHGSQIVTGLNMLQSEDGAKYKAPTLIEPGGDLGHNGDTAWVTTTRNALAQPNHGIKMVVWSWCGGVSDNTKAGIDTYLDEMNKLEQQYPNIVFVYMTGHLDGTGPTGNLYRGNDQIRDYCKKNGKVLFDFADIESYDPAGTYYPDESDGCGWCSTWCQSKSCPSCGSCAHSHCFNCYRKGQAFWWLLVQLTGWSS